jgi:hypothetical protein
MAIAQMKTTIPTIVAAMKPACLQQRGIRENTMSTVPGKTFRKPVNLMQHGNTLTMEPIVDALRPEFRTPAYAPNRRSGLAIDRSLRSLLRVDGWRDAMYAHAGLKLLVVEALHRLGFSVNDHGRDIDSRLKKLSDPALPSDEKASRIITDRLRAERGLIYFAPADPILPARVIAIAANAWPNRRIACAVTKVSAAHKLTR